MRKIIPVLLVFILMFACGWLSLGLIRGGLSWLSANGILTAPELVSNVEFDVIMPNETVTPTIVAETRPVLTETAVPTEATPTEIVNQCVAATLVTNPKIDQVVFDNLDDGDPWVYTLTLVNPAEDPKNLKATLMVITAPGESFDIVHGKMLFSSYRLEGTLDQVICFVNSLGAKEVGFKLFVGENTPEGWSTPTTLSAGWWDELTFWKYTEQAIDAGKPVEGYCEPTATECTIAPKSGLAHGQFWLNGQPGIVVYPAVEAGYKFTVAEGWQGSYWTYAFVQGNLFDRIYQSSVEAYLRDDIKVIVMPYCGANQPKTNLVVKVNDAVVYTAEWLAGDAPLTYTLNGMVKTITGFTCEAVK